MRLQPGASKLSSELSELVVYTCSVPFRGFEQAAGRPAAEMSSFSESKALRLIKDSGRVRVGRSSRDRHACGFTVRLVFLVSRDPVCPSQQPEAEQDLPFGPAPPILQLQPSGHVERWLPDW